MDISSSLIRHHFETGCRPNFLTTIQLLSTTLRKKVFIVTYETYTAGIERAELLEKVASAMSEKRFKHVLGVEKSAIELAERYGYDTEKAGLAGLIHDYAKEISWPRIFRLELIKINLDPELKK